VSKIFEGTKLTMDDGFVTKVDGYAKSGEAILSIFLNSDGTLKPDAHQRLAMAVGGQELVLNQAKKLESSMITKAREEVLQGTPRENVKPSSSGGVTNKSKAQEAQEKVQRRNNSIFPEDNGSTY